MLPANQFAAEPVIRPRPDGERPSALRLGRGSIPSGGSERKAQVDIPNDGGTSRYPQPVDKRGSGRAGSARRSRGNRRTDHDRRYADCHRGCPRISRPEPVTCGSWPSSGRQGDAPCRSTGRPVSRPGGGRIGCSPSRTTGPAMGLSGVSSSRVRAVEREKAYEGAARPKVSARRPRKASSRTHPTAWCSRRARTGPGPRRPPG